MGTSYHRKVVLTPTRRNNTAPGHRQRGVVPSGQGKEDRGGVGNDRPGSVKRPRFSSGVAGSSQSFVTTVDALQFYKLRSLQA